MNRLRAGAEGTIRVRAQLSAGWQARPRFQDFTKVVYVRLTGAADPTAEPLRGETESITLLTQATGYIVVPENVTLLHQGDFVDVNLLPGFSFAR